ncbi:MAG: AMP-dependent synthetase/ligase [Nanoarchaeota archaeon]
MDTLQDLVTSLSSKDFTPAIWRSGKGMQSYSSLDLHKRICHIASGIHEMGVSKGDRVAVISDNHHDWLPTVLGIDYNGIIDVPRGSDSTDDELKYILEHSDPELVFTQDQRQADRIKRLSNPSHIITLEGSCEMTVDDVVEMGSDNGSFFCPVNRDDIASIMYTSGTSGTPKGVMLTHGNYMANAHALHRFLGDLSGDKFFHILPNWHAFGRGELHLGLLGGADMFYSDIRTLLRDAKEQQPSIIVSVPRLWESVYDKLMRRSSVRFASRLPSSYLRHKIVGSAVNEALGGNIRLIVSGGGGLAKHIDSFFDKVGIEILEGYGLTESSPVISARPPGSRQAALGSVGIPLDNVDVSVRDRAGADVHDGQEGILHAKGPSIMKGYFRNEDATRKVIGPDNYFNTGDTGYVNERGYLVITGRADDRITLSNGENVNPARIEQHLISQKYIKHAVVVGGEWDSSAHKITPWKKLGALIVPQYDALKETLADISEMVSESEFINHPRVKDFLEKHVRSSFFGSEKFRPFEYIHAVVPVDEFSYGQELTATDKIRRTDIIRSLHSDKINALGQYLR